MNMDICSTVKNMHIYTNLLVSSKLFSDRLKQSQKFSHELQVKHEIAIVSSVRQHQKISGIVINIEILHS